MIFTVILPFKILYAITFTLLYAIYFKVLVQDIFPYCIPYVFNIKQENLKFKILQILLKQSMGKLSQGDYFGKI